MSLKPLFIFFGFVIAFVFILSGTSTSVFVCHPPDWMKDADGIEASCSWTMFKHSFVGPSDTPGEYVLHRREQPLTVKKGGHSISTSSKASVQYDTTPTAPTAVLLLLAEVGNEETSTATSTEEEKNTTTTTPTSTTNETYQTSFTNDTNTTEMTTTNTTELTSADNSSTPTDTNETTGPTDLPTTTAAPKPTQYISIEVGLDDMQCKPLASHLRAMGALSILACILSGVGIVFAALPFLGLEHCGTRCHNSIITLTLAAACLVLTLTTWSIGANAYSTKFEASPIVVEEKDGDDADAFYNGNPYNSEGDDGLSCGRRSEKGSTVMWRVRSAFGGHEEEEEKDYNSAEGIVVTEEGGKAAGPPCTLAPATSSSRSSAHHSRRKKSVPSCAPYSLKKSPFNVVYASGWALPFTATFVLLMIIFASYHADRSGSGSDLGTGSYHTAGDLNQPIWAHAPAAPISSSSSSSSGIPQQTAQAYPYPHPHQAMVAQQPPQHYQQLQYTTQQQTAVNYGVVLGAGGPTVQQQQSVEALLFAEQQRQARAAAAAVRAHPSADYSLQ